MLPDKSASSQVCSPGPLPFTKAVYQVKLRFGSLTFRLQHVGQMPPLTYAVISRLAHK